MDNVSITLLMEKKWKETLFPTHTHSYYWIEWKSFVDMIATTTTTTNYYFQVTNLLFMLLRWKREKVKERRVSGEIICYCFIFSAYVGFNIWCVYIFPLQG
jgi:hypothetical protein